MATAIPQTEDAVNNVLEACRDAEYGFATAADAIRHNENLKKELMEYSRERSHFVAELAAAMQENGWTPRQHGSASGLIHRGWLKLMKIRPDGNERAVLSACASGEESAVQAYAEAAAPLPTRLADLIATQYPVVKLTHSRIRNLRDAAEGM